MNKDNEETEESKNKSPISKSVYTKDLAEKVYGKSIINKSNNMQLENKLCTGIHEGINILITKGEYGNSPNEQFRISEQGYNKKENIKHFEKNFLIYKRSITKLKDTIQKEILVDLEDSTVLSNSGKLIPSYLWKPKYLNNDKIFLKEVKDEMAWADEHRIGIAKDIDAQIIEDLRANFLGECTEVGMYIAMSRQADREGYPEVAEAYKRIAWEEAEHASKFAELLGEVVYPSTKQNLSMRVEAEFGACAGKKELATAAKKQNLDAIHDTVHEMCKDEARHGRAFKGLLDRYFSE